MRIFIILLIVCSDVFAKDVLPPPDANIEPYKEYFEKLAEQGQFSLFQNNLGSDDLISKRIIFEHRIGYNKKGLILLCKTGYTSKIQEWNL